MSTIRLTKNVLSLASPRRRTLICPIRSGHLHRRTKVGHRYHHQPPDELLLGSLPRNFAAASAPPPPSYDPAHPPILFDLVLSADWKSALKRIASHPFEARYRHPRGYTLLHCAVEYGSPVELIDKMVKAHPEALQMKDWQGRSIVDVAINNETKSFLENISQSDLQQTHDAAKESEMEEIGSGSNISLSQMKAISRQLLEMETSCQSLRVQLDGLIEQVSKK